MSTSARDVFATVFGSLTGIDTTKETWVAKLYDTAKPIIDSGQVASNDPMIFDIVLSDKNAPPEFQNRFKALTDLKSKGSTFVPTVAQYMQMENKYKATLQSVGLNELANSEEIGKFISNEVSLDELSGRIEKAFVAIDTADELTKQVLSEQFPGVTRADVAKSLLMGNQGAYDITKKIATAQVTAEAKRAGITPMVPTQEIVAQGLSQQETRKAFQSVAQQQQGIAQAGRTFGSQLSEQDLQKQLQQEATGIQTSQELKRLRSQARAEFAGGTGIQTGSLRKKNTGSSQLQVHVGLTAPNVVVSAVAHTNPYAPVWNRECAFKQKEKGDGCDEQRPKLV